MADKPLQCAFCHRHVNRMDREKELLIVMKHNPKIAICSTCVKNAANMPDANKGEMHGPKVVYIGHPDVDLDA